MGLFFIEFLVFGAIFCAIVVAGQRSKKRRAEEEQRAMSRAAHTAESGKGASARNANATYEGTLSPYAAPEGPSPADRARQEARVTVAAHTQVSGHVVKPANESDHVHMETSISGFTECPPQKKAEPARQKSDGTSHKGVTAAPAQAAPAGMNLRFDGEAAKNAFIYAEVFGKPKALRR